MNSSGDRSPTWTFLTHHARVLLEIARDPQVRLRDIAARIGITERAVQGIVTDLHEAGYLTRTKVGRRNHYTLNLDQSFRYPTEAGLPVGLLVNMFTQRDLPDGVEAPGDAAREPAAPPAPPAMTIGAAAQATS
ncbi:helix-turn-helix transcriptional regulator [Thermoactinospora rubra]|uniref:helix-turn-helix transcriptional regulator n=1 Tax=Thermoactinospora rubra TaxID=1088767 RepID=UPI000A11D7B4|nr:helix-turn-helix domain-containing protein [Thermoactinospora rubra]